MYRWQFIIKTAGFETLDCIQQDPDMVQWLSPVRVAKDLKFRETTEISHQFLRKDLLR
jgi:hypothetical protein